MPPFLNLVIMNIRHSLLGLFLPLSLLSCHTVEKEADGRPLSSYVNPFVGASTNTELAGASHGLGKTFPGATAPFGMVQVSPNTITGGDNGPGYSYEHTTIEGFAFTQMSGIGWYGDLGNFLVMPTIGDLHTFAGTEDKPEEGYRSRYDKSTEKASAGYYSVFLSDYKIQAEATALPHSGMLRFTFPESKEARIQVDLARRVGGTSTLQSVEVVDDHTIKGWMQCTPDGGGWGNGDGKADYTVYFYAQFSKPFSGHGVWSADIPDDWRRKREDVCSERYREAIRQASIHPSVSAFEGKHLGFYANFETKPDEVILLKSGISYTSLKNAEENLAAEMKDFDFDRTHAECVRLWNDELAKVSVEGGTDEEKRVFYTALYHTLIDPRLCSDINGEYTGADKKIHQTGKFRKRTIFSGWDVFRSQMPLQTIINPEMAAAREISHLLRFPGASKIDTFADGRVRLIKFALPDALDGVAIREIPTRLKSDILVCAVERDGGVIIPNGNFVLQTGDQVTFLATQEKAHAFFQRIHLAVRPVRNALIVGGGAIAFYLSQELLENHVRVRIVERDPARCDVLAQALPEAQILCEDGSNREFLLSEGLTSTEAFVALTNIDEENVLLTLFAKKHSNGKLVTKINRLEFDDILAGLDLGSIVYPKYMTCDYIVQYVRALQNEAGSNIKTLYRILDDRVEALEFTVHEKSRATGVPLSQLHLKKNLLLCCITRGNEIKIPRGGDEIQVGDNVIVVTLEHGLHDLRDIVED